MPRPSYLLKARVSPARIMFPASQFQGESTSGSASSAMMASCRSFASLQCALVYHRYIIAEDSLAALRVLEEPTAVLSVAQVVIMRFIYRLWERRRRARCSPAHTLTQRGVRLRLYDSSRRAG